MASSFWITFLFLATTGGIGFVQAEDAPARYRIKSGDSLGRVLRGLKLTPVFGRGNSLEKTLQLNPTLARLQGDLILPGTLVTLPVDRESQLKTHLSMNRQKGWQKSYKDKSIDYSDVDTSDWDPAAFHIKRRKNPLLSNGVVQSAHALANKRLNVTP